MEYYWEILLVVYKNWSFKVMRNKIIKWKKLGGKKEGDNREEEIGEG